MRVECLSCGHVADRIRRASDQRTPWEILAYGYCGECHEPMKYGRVRFTLDGGATWSQAESPLSYEPDLPLPSPPEAYPSAHGAIHVDDIWYKAATVVGFALLALSAPLLLKGFGVMAAVIGLAIYP